MQRAKVMLPEILGALLAQENLIVITVRRGWNKSPQHQSFVGAGVAREGSEATYRSGLFCVSITAAIGMPKLETGPQKSRVV